MNVLLPGNFVAEKKEVGQIYPLSGQPEYQKAGGLQSEQEMHATRFAFRLRK